MGVDEDQVLTWEEKHALRMRPIEMIAADVRTMLRTVGPRVSAAQDENFAVRHCLKCNPPPEVFTCPMCDWQTDVKWRYGVHLATRPGWCLERGKKKERAWAAKA